METAKGIRVQIIKCKTCGMTYAGCKDGMQTESWYKDLAKAMKTDNAIIETIDSDGKIFSDQPLNKCCGKKVRTIKPINRVNH